MLLYHSKPSEDTVRRVPKPSVGKALHLPVLDNSSYSRRQRVRRYLSLGFVLAAIASLLASYRLAWWTFILYAPQYPSGLRLHVSLTGVSGDVSEVDTLNHYIGMASLANAAPNERALAGYGITVLCVLLVGTLLFAGRRLSRLILIPGAALPVAFLVDTFYWLYRFGHSLNPAAPLKIEPFTPAMFGN